MLARFKSSNIRWYVYLLFITLIAFGPLLSGSFALKWDATALNLPWKNFILDSIWSGRLPLWTPYMNGGFPLMADPSTWYPISWLIGVGGHYNLWHLHFEFLIHVYIAGIGFFLLGKHFQFTARDSFLIAVLYMLSGFVVGNAQHIGWVVSAAWLPFCVLLFLKVMAEDRKAVPLLVFSMFFFLSGGYPPFFFTFCYGAIIYWLIEQVKAYNKSDRRLLGSRVLLFSIVTVLFIALSSVVIISTQDVKPFMTRGSGLLEKSGSFSVNFGSLSFQSLLTFLFPFAGTVNDFEFWGADYSMINCFIGGLPIVITLLVLFQGKFRDHNLVVSFLIGVGFLMVAMGEVFPFRYWLAYLLPFFDMFRFPSLFRLFTLFFFLLSFGFLLKKDLLTQKSVLFSFGLLVVFGGGVYLFKGSSMTVFNGMSIIDTVRGLTVYDRVGVELLVYLGIYVFLFNFRGKDYKKGLFFGLVIMQVVSVWMNSFSTVLGRYDVNLMSSIIESKNGNSPDISKSFRELDNATLQKEYKGLVNNLAFFERQPTLDGGGPYTLNCFKEVSIDSLYSKSFVDIQPEGFENELKLKNYKANLFEFDVTTQTGSHLVLYQNFYKDWRASVNGEKVEINKVNKAFMKVDLPIGTSAVTFEFKPIKVMVAFYISVLTFLVLLIVLVFNQFSPKKFS